MALDVRVQDQEGHEIDLSELCRDDEPYPISRVDAAAISEALSQHGDDDDELRKSFQIENDDEVEAEEDDDFAYEEEIAEEYGSDFYGDEADE